MPSTLDVTGFSQKTGISRRPLLRNALFTDLQNGSYIAAIYTLVQSLIMIGLSLFDLYLLVVASPGATYYRQIGINFLFVYSGNQLVRYMLIVIDLVSFLLSFYLAVGSSILIRALRKEYEKRFYHWLVGITIWVGWQTIALVFKSTANDLYYPYHQALLVIFLMCIILNILSGLVVYSNYLELKDIANLEDLARIKFGGTMSTLNTTSRSYSLDTVRSTVTTASV